MEKNLNNLKNEDKENVIGSNNDGVIKDGLNGTSHKGDKFWYIPKVCIENSPPCM